MGGFDISHFNGAFVNRTLTVANPLLDGNAETQARRPAENAPADQVRHSPGEVAHEIKNLVKAAVARGAKGVTLSDLKAAAGKSRSVYADLKSLVETAQEPLAAIGKLTGRQLAKAYETVNGEPDSDGFATFNFKNNDEESKHVRELMDAAIDAQGNLSDKLCKLINETNDDGLKERLDEMMLRADSRASDLTTLVMEMTEMAKSIEEPPQENQNGEDANNAEKEKVLNRDASSLLGSLSVVRHGNADAMPALVNDAELGAFMGKLADLNRDISALKKNKAKTVRADLLRRISEMEKHLDRLSLGSANAPFLKDLARTLAEGRQRVENSEPVLKQTAKAARQHLHEQTFRDLSAKFALFRKGACWKFILEHAGQRTGELDKLVNTFDALESASRTYAETPSPENLKALERAKDAFIGFVDDADDGNAPMRTVMETVRDALKNETTQEALRQKTGNRPEGVSDEEFSKIKEADEQFLAKYSNLGVNFNPAIALFGVILCRTDHLKVQLDQLTRYAALSTDKAFTEARLGRADFAHLVLDQPLSDLLARVNSQGAPDEMLEKTCRDEFISGTDDKFGAGKANTVSLVKYTLPDGRVEERVFKDELSNRVGSSSLSVAAGAWSDAQQMAKLNYAASKTAELIGTPQAMVKTTMGMHDGAFGIFMTKAPGKDAKNTVRDAAFISMGLPIANLTPSPAGKALGEIARDGGYDPANAEQRRFIGSLMKGFADLGWNDHLTGQSDRHGGNFFMHKDENGMAVVTGIDNDACFPAYKTGLTSFALTRKMEEKILNGIAKALADGDRPTRLKAAAEMLKNCKETVTLPSGNRVTVIKFSEKLPTAVRYALNTGVGVNSGLVTPPYMSRAIFEKLTDEKNQRELKALWRSTLSKECADAAEARLEEMVACALKLHDDGRILEDDDWGDPEKVKEMLNWSLPASNDGPACTEEAKNRADLISCSQAKGFLGNFLHVKENV